MNRITVFILITVFAISSGFGFQQSDTLQITTHLEKITKSDTYRNFENTGELNRVAQYIFDDFKQYADSVYFQEFKVEGETYKNVVCSFGSDVKAKTIVIGAHYDVCGNQEGADDNASGVAGLLEIARLLKDKKLNYRIELVAYTLEEPPFFKTAYMGSYVHAKSLADNKIDVFGMVSLEMIGYFSEEPDSQNYPMPSLSSVYGTKGDFITLVGKKEMGGFSENFSKAFKKNAQVKTVVFENTDGVPSIGLSDHINYWEFGFNALMITDTAFLRNRNYHTKYDTMDKLDIPKMAKVVDSIVATLQNLN